MAPGGDLRPRQEALGRSGRAIRAVGGEVHAVPGRRHRSGYAGPAGCRHPARFGGLDILVPNAGGPPPGRALEVTDEQIAAAVNANLVTSIRLVREALPLLQADGWGRICCITSSSIKQPMPGLALSNLARTGLWAWAKTAAADLFPSGVTLNVVCPGGHATDRMRQLGGDGAGLGDPARFGRVVAFLCSEPAAFISGTAVMVDGAASAGLL